MQQCYRERHQTLQCRHPLYGSQVHDQVLSQANQPRFPIRSEDEVVEQVVEVCKRNTGVRLAMVTLKRPFWSNCHFQIDHISSPSAIVFPIAKLAKELHKLGVLLLVDGAHAPGQVGGEYSGGMASWLDVEMIAHIISA